MSEEENKIPELFFGIVSPVGTDLESVKTSLENSLARMSYNTKIIKFSQMMRENVKGLTQNLDLTQPEDERISNYMDAGDALRAQLNDKGILSGLAMLKIRLFRKEKGFENKTIPSQAYVFDSLKHPDEGLSLLSVYGINFWLISAYSPHDDRLDRLAEKIRDSRSGQHREDFKSNAMSLIQRDQEDSENEFGQNVRKIFPRGDVFIDTRDPVQMQVSIDKFIDLIFSNPFHTPTREETGMFYAYASSIRSSSLSRRVGAAIANENGNVIATGTNDVPKSGGGLCDPEVDAKFTEIGKKKDSNTKRKMIMLENFFESLRDEGWLSSEKTSADVNELVKEAMIHPKLKNTQLMDVTEFGREVHAEMAALMDASRRTISVQNGDLFCTTFPCHICAKHIIAAGIKEVIYIEPYPKSLAEDLFDDFIAVDKGPVAEKVEFKPFVGIAPRRFLNLYSWLDRKTKFGDIENWEAKNSTLRHEELSYIYLKREISYTAKTIKTFDRDPNLKIIFS